MHEFLSENGGKYGGWHEFNHILFLQSRQKYIKENTANYEIELKSFVDDLLIKIPGKNFIEIKFENNVSKIIDIYRYQWRKDNGTWEVVYDVNWVTETTTWSLE